ncbi:double-strand break repair helicase AddA [Oecophyllibacter saccharovorans]|uniref:DNA 3'-5' helicase n=1 Tax=Oecophyllibacter saccharovorans TaxID=2558360 RepID=A0A506ULY7_9PROT|nr:double-strand break repair helicase AddA [Oecophyllibacter saccharovorans]TPW34242.1 double-strand break repair helicase AddA [Oecophyllibacter saccharovorans]
MSGEKRNLETAGDQTGSGGQEGAASLRDQGLALLRAKAEADAAQLVASDPMASVFVSASAGSGKTKLLIDRLLRLMLPLFLPDREGEMRLVAGTDPARILCLTYTKAAAAEMATRLQDRLGRWVTLPEEKLAAELTALQVPDTPETRAQARGLFLRVLDLPGGLRIETIHAFCQSLLRRFPIEAAIDPRFSLMEESDSGIALRAALEEEVAAHPATVRDLAGQVGLDDLVKRLAELNEKAGRLRGLLARVSQQPDQVSEDYAHLLEIVSTDRARLQRDMQSLADEEKIRAGLQAALPLVTASAQQKYVQPLLQWLTTPAEKRDPARLQTLLLTQKGEVRKMESIITKEARKSQPDLPAWLTAEGERQLKLLEAGRALELLAVNRDFLQLAAPVLVRYQQEKTMRGLVDYNDLIARTRLLLNDPGAAWVMYKLDGGIDHLLLDEVQDTSGLQWEIAGALTEEFFSGEGVHDQARPRTVFAVGDFKQSIYSFQGAEPDQFHTWRDKFAQRVKKAGLLWAEPQLNVSFRSVPPVLETVDSVFAAQPASAGLRDGDAPLPAHVSARPGQGGRVELWPLVPQVEKEEGQETGPWRAPTVNRDRRTPPQILAAALADWLQEHLGRPLQPGTPPLKPEDVMILVPRRSAFLRALVRALKARQIPVVSFLRAEMLEQPAVQDVLTLCATLLLPQDDLSLACVLTSPLGGLSDASLMALCTDDGHRSLLGPSGRPLWTVLRSRHRERAEWRAAWERLEALFNRVDYETPYGLMVRILGQNGGRSALQARLGVEAAEPLDELLNAALRYEERHTPSLQGFLHWLQGAELTIRREAESVSDAVRLMTVHGAKGLQSRLVILPDTTSSGQREPGLLWEEVAGMEMPLWVPRRDMSVPASRYLAEQARERTRRERNRLLYVALTRASDSLLICGWEQGRPRRGEEGVGPEAEEPTDSEGGENWYQMCRAGLERLAGVKREAFERPLLKGDVSQEGEGWSGEKLVLEEACTQPEKSSEKPAAVVSESAALPDWLGQAPDWQVRLAPLEHALARPLTPSRPEGAEYGLQPPVPGPLDEAQDREGLQEGRDAAASAGPLALEARLKTAARLQGTSAASRRARAMQRGVLVHRLLQLLPDIAPDQRRGHALAYLQRPGWALASAEAEKLAGQVLQVMEAGALAPLFGAGSRAEQAVSGVLGRDSASDGPVSDGPVPDGAGRVVLGQVDRFCLHEDVLWLCDYKTGRRPPGNLAGVPEVYLRQMAAYRAVLQQIYPGLPARCFLVWTEGGDTGPLVMELPGPVLDRALQALLTESRP